MTYFDILRMVWQRKSLLLLGLIAALSLGALYYAQTTALHQSSAEVLVVRKRPEVITGDKVYAAPTGDYLATHAVLLKSPVIVERAIKDSDLGSLETFTSPKYVDQEFDIATAVNEGINIKIGSLRSGRGSQNVLTVSFTGPVAEECPMVVSAVIDSYEKFLEETYRDMGEDTITMISHARDDLQKDLTEQEAAYREFRLKSPMVSNGTTDVNPLHARLTAIEQQLSEALLREATFQTQLATLEEAKEAGAPPEELVEIVTNLSEQANAQTGRAANGLDNQLFDLIQEQERMKQNYGPNHPHVKSIEKRIKATRNFFAFPNSAFRDATAPGAPSEVTPSDSVEKYEKYLTQELASIEISRKLLSDLYAKEHDSAKKLTSYELRDEGFQQRIRRTRELYDGVVQQLQGANLVKDYDGFKTRVISQAKIGERVSPKATIVFPLAALLGSLLGCGLAIGAETTDRRFRTTAEITNELQSAIVGSAPELLPVPRNKVRDKAIDKMLYAYHMPSSNITEIYRGVRTALYFSTHGKDCKTIQVTSAGPGDGKSTLAGNLAICIAQSGKSVLLIDGDLRRPRIHKMFGVENHTGLASVIGLDVDIADAVLETPVSNLFVMPSGPLPPDPSELLSSHRLGELLSTVREQYDYVIIDTGPLLAITDPSIVATRTDGVVMAVRINNNTRQQAKQARQLLDSLGVRVLGVFVNGAPSKKSDYGSYQYSYADHNYTESNTVVGSSVPR